MSLVAKLTRLLRGEASLRVLVALLLALNFVACRRFESTGAAISPEYDPKTGRLTLLKYDSNGNGVVDTWSYMDGPRVVRIEIDQDEDGKIDRWEYYDAAQKLEKVGLSRQHDGIQDSWQYFASDVSVARIELSTHRDGIVTRIEYFD